MSSASDIDRWLAANTFPCPLGKVSKAQCAEMRKRLRVGDSLQRTPYENVRPKKTQRAYMPSKCDGCDWKHWQAHKPEVVEAMAKLQRPDEKEDRGWTGLPEWAWEWWTEKAKEAGDSLEMHLVKTLSEQVPADYVKRWAMARI